MSKVFSQHLFAHEDRNKEAEKRTKGFKKIFFAHLETGYTLELIYNF